MNRAPHRHPARLSLTTCVAVFIGCTLPSAAQHPGDDLDRALQSVGLTRRAIRIDPVDLNTFDQQPRRLPIVEWALANPLKTPVLADYIADKCSISDPAGGVDVLAQISRWLGKVVRRGLIGDPLERARRLADGDDALSAALERTYRLGGAEFPADVRARILENTNGAPAEQLRRVAVLMQTICDAHEWAELAVAAQPVHRWTAILKELRKTLVESGDGEEDESPFDDFLDYRALADSVARFDASLMLVGAQEVTFAVDALAKAIRKLDVPPTWNIEVETPIGLVSIGREHRVTGNRAPLLLIDWSGSDRYTALASNGAAGNRVSVAIDFDGDDHYVNTAFNGGNFGSGQCGIGLLFDLAGNDEYRITRNGQGHAVFGVGMVYDAAGNDTYVAVEHAQSAAYAGAAVLIDVSGNDRYDIHTAGQGYAGPGGGAVLADVSGDDQYTANDDDIRFPSSQSDEHNNSLAQGAGVGWRGDYKEGISVAGGVGVLFDGGGTDAYKCGVFGQGVGYWLGMGLLVDRGGDDHYEGVWYVQGASAHFAAGILLDARGDDHYKAHMNMAQGAGHDIGIGVLFDDAGSDRYSGVSLSLGAGNAGGLGLFVDRLGDDWYAVTRGDSNLGYASANRAGSLRAAIPGTGLFLDLAGLDHYPDGRGGNSTQWGSSPAPPDGVMPGVAHGIDLNRAPAR